jgi:protein CpxP
MNKPLHFTLVLAASLLLLVSARAANSQNQSSNVQGAQRPADLRDIRVADNKKQLAHLCKKLKLTSEQQTRVRAILTERDRQIEMIQASESLPNKSKAARIETIVANSNDLVESVLNSKQRQKFEEALARQRKRKDASREADLGNGLPSLPLSNAPRSGSSSRA